MMGGYLELLVLKELKKKPNTGYSLMEALKKATGKKPSPGSMYPLLNDLLTKGFITVDENGRKKTYTITKKGKRFIEVIIKNKEKLLLNHMALIEKCFKPDEKRNDIIKEHRRIITLIHTNLPLWKELKETLMQLIISPDFKDNEIKIKNIIQDTIKRLDKIKVMKK